MSGREKARQVLAAELKAARAKGDHITANLIESELEDLRK